MWELRTRASLGRLSSQRILLFFSSLILAIFVIAMVNSTPVIAVDAVRNGDNVTYNNMTFVPAAANQLPTGLPANTEGYRYIDNASGKAYFLLAQGSARTATGLRYVSYDVAGDGTYSNPSPPTGEAVNVVQGPTQQNQNPNQPQGQQDQNQQAQGNNPGTSSSCDGKLTDGIGWIVCPISNFLASGMDHVYQGITNFLIIRSPSLDPNSSTFKIWAMMRDLANVCFVIAFMVIVYSQLTQVGLSNYNLKKMIPRLVVAAILVNLSYYICALAIDLSNVIGHSVYDIFMNIYNQMNKVNNYTTTDLPSWSSLTSFILAGGTGAVGGYIALVAAGGVKAALILLIPSLVLLLLAVLVAFLIMAARQALITVLVIVSPLAFVAYVLPNTEKYFDRWKGSFATLLFLYPIFSAIFGGAQIAGLAIMQNANNLITLILGMAVQVAPLAITPILVKFSGGILGKISGMVNNRNKGMVDRTRNWAKEAADERKHRVLADSRKFRGPMANSMRKIDRGRRKRQMRIKQYQEDLDNTASGEYYRERRTRHLGDTLNSERARNYKERESGRYEELRTAIGARGGVDNLALERAIQQAGIRKASDADNLREQATEIRINTEQIAAIGLAKRVSEEQQKADFAHALEVADDYRKDKEDDEKVAKGIIAKKEYTRKYTDEIPVMIDDQLLHEYAAGIKVDSGGIEKVVAIAKKERFKVMKEGIDDRFDTIPNEIWKDNAKLAERTLEEFSHLNSKGQVEVNEQAYAYIKRMHGNGGPGKQKVREILQHVDMLHSNGKMSDGEYLDFREVASVLDLPSLGRDVVLWASNTTDKNGKLMSLHDLSNDLEKSWKKITVDGFSSMDDDSKKVALRKLAVHDPSGSAYNTFMRELKSDTIAMSKLRGEVRRLVDADVQYDNAGWQELETAANGGAYHPGVDSAMYPNASKLFR